ncbi:glucosaminidase domain-containing protein [Paraburkholderia sp. IW21]|uniref:glucosaminidase domain-containing protein n=1 Tax=Paraburkholderia sp. IW21 TaxID=3242488 RepID=UPI00351F855F
MADNGWTPVSDASSADESASGGWVPAASGTPDGTPQAFAQTYGPTINNIASQLKVDPSIIAGQLALETGYGKSVIPGTNNLGNIKSTTGKGVSATDNQTGSNDVYAAYPSTDDFANSYVNLIKNKYPNAVGAKDATSFATALKAGGYAQDPKYVGKVSGAANIMSNVLGAITGSSNANASETPQPSSASPDVNAFLKQYGGASQPAQPAASANDSSDDVSSFLKQYGPYAGADKAPGTVTTTTNPVMMGARDAIYSKLDPVMGWIAKGANWIAPDSQFAKDAAQGVNDLHATNAAQQQAYDSAQHGTGSGLLRGATNLAGSVAMTPMTGGGLGSTLVQTAAQGALSDPNNPLAGAAIGGAGGAVGHALGHVVGAVAKPVISKITGATKQLADAETQLANAGNETGGTLSPAEQQMAGKIADNINADNTPQSAQDVAAQMQSNAQSNVPGYQRTAAETTDNPTVQAIQQGLDKSDNNGGLAARAAANADANTDHLRQGATSDTQLQAMKDAFQDGQDTLAARGNAELGPVTPTQDSTVFNTPAMQRNLQRANVVAQNDGDTAIQQAFNAPNDDLVAGWNGTASNPAITAALERDRNFVTSPMYENVLGAAKPLPVDGQLQNLLERPVMQKALREVETYKLNAGDQTPVINNGSITPQDLNIAKMHLDSYIQRMNNPMDAASADKWQQGAYLDVRKQINNLLENKVQGFADVNKEFARRSDQIAESQFLTDPNMVSALGKLNVNKLDSLVKSIQAGKANNNPLDPAKSVSASKLAQLTQMRDDAVAAMNRNSAQGIHGDAYNYLRQAAAKDPIAAQQLQDHLTANSPAYKQFYDAAQTGQQKIAHQENFNELVKKFDTRTDGNVSWHDVKNVTNNAADFSADHLNRLNNVRDNLERYASRTEKVAGSDTASNFAKREGFDSLVNAERGKGIGNYMMGEGGQRLSRTVLGSIASGLGFAHAGPLGAVAADYAMDKAATGAAKTAGRLFGGQTDEALAAKTAANRAAVEHLMLNPQRLGDAIQALDKHATDTKAIKENLISKVKGVQTAGGLLGAVAAGQIANQTGKDQRKK